MNQIGKKTITISATEKFPVKIAVVDAICNNCNKHFESMRAVTMHLKMAGVNHSVTFINYGDYDRSTGLLRETKRLRK